ncbi:MAG TPA: glycosyltransferase family 2 protein, partial [Thermoanaerobaculia bacterium]|nr:glycosyltransferase family 2 protein [Thermoanaerobaculia bacterium]
RPEGRAPGKLLIVVPSRAEGARVGDLPGDVRREISLKENTAAAASGAAPVMPRVHVDVLVVLDGPDADAEARLKADGVDYLSKKSAGPAKGDALAFLAEQMDDRLDAYDFILVFDADMRLPEGFFRDLRVPGGTEAFQLPVRPSGVPAPGAPRVEALSLAEARLDDLARDAAGLPVRLRGKAMGFSPRAFRLGPAAATRTTAEDSEATLALLAKGIVVRALDGPMAFDEPSSDAGAMGRSRARWFGGHMKLLFSGLGDLVRSFVRRPVGTLVLAADLWLRPRIFLLGTLAFLAGASDLAMVVFSSSGAWSASAHAAGGAAAAGGATGAAMPVALLVCLLLLSLEGKAALLFEWLSLAAVRHRIGFPAECPPVALADLSDSLLVWAGAVVRGVLAPSRWHRARPEA